MSSREEFAALLRADPESGFTAPSSSNNNASSPKKKPPQSPIPILRTEQSPLLPSNLPPVSPRTTSKPPALVYDVKPPQLDMIMSAPQMNRKHIRSNSDFAHVADPSHPLKLGSSGASSGLPPPHSRKLLHTNKPPLRSITTTPGTSGVLGIPMPPPPPSAPSNRRGHRRAKSDMPKSVSFGANTITKSDLLKNFPDPRWSGNKMHVRKRSGSGDVFVEGGGGVHSRSSSGVFGYGSIGMSDRSGGDGSYGGGGGTRGGMHARTKSDMSFSSAVTDLTKSALVREITEGGRIRFQLPKDNFRILMDCSLETGNVYSRKLLDNEEECFIEFHTEDTTPSPDCPCHCTCDRCHRCSSKQKALPPALFVMAVDSTLYRRMMDEIVESKQMPCGLFFCGHHEDVRSPDIRIAVGIVSMVFVCLILATEAFGGD